MTYLPDSKVTVIVIHYSATPIEKDFSAADIDRMHRARGYNEIGYHYFIRKDGTVETGRDLSVPGRFEQGAHSYGENDSSIGICFEGGVSASAPNVGYDTRTAAQKAAMVHLIADMQRRFPGAIVKGHRDMPGAATQCPGFDAAAWWDSVVTPDVGSAKPGLPTWTQPPTPQPGDLKAQLFLLLRTHGLYPLAGVAGVAFGFVDYDEAAQTLTVHLDAAGAAMAAAIWGAGTTATYKLSRWAKARGGAT